MKGLLCLFVLCVALPAAAAPPQIRLDPAAPVFGRPVTIIIPLSDHETTLAGLPELGTFEPLAPPIRSDGEIRIVVLPMRPGEQEIPPFPLQVGRSRLIDTAPLVVTVLEGIAQNAAPAPFKRRPIPLVGSGPGRWVVILLAAIGGSLLAIYLYRRWKTRQILEKLPTQAQLQLLRKRLLNTPPEPGRDALLAEIDVLRFAPVEVSAERLAELRKIVTGLLKRQP